VFSTAQNLHPVIHNLDREYGKSKLMACVRHRLWVKQGQEEDQEEDRKEDQEEDRKEDQQEDQSQRLIRLRHQDRYSPISCL